MFVITDHNDVIIKITDSVDFQDNGNALVDNGSLAIAKYLIKEIYEVSEVGENVKESMWCYTDDQGFYKNEDYTESITTDQELEIIKEQITNLELALCEMYENGGASNG